MASNVNLCLNFAPQHFAAESYLDQVLNSTRPLDLVLQDGNNDIRKAPTT
jgi:hypothetical protein